MNELTSEFLVSQLLVKLEVNKYENATKKEKKKKMKLKEINSKKACYFTLEFLKFAIKHKQILTRFINLKKSFTSVLIVKAYNYK